jgi:hypothetical protein
VGIPQATGVVGFLVLGDQAGGNRNHNDEQTKLAVDSREITEARDGQKKHDLRAWRRLLAKKPTSLRMKIQARSGGYEISQQIPRPNSSFIIKLDRSQKFHVPNTIHDSASVKLQTPNSKLFQIASKNNMSLPKHAPGLPGT